MKIRPYLESDEPTVAALWRQVFPDSPPWNHPETDIRRKLAIQRDLFLVAISHTHPVGTAMAGYDGHRGWVYYVAVHPKHRRRGVGTALMWAVEQRLAQLGCPKLNLQVRADNEAVVSFYKRLGYVQEQRVSMGKRLDPVEYRTAPLAEARAAVPPAPRRAHPGKAPLMEDRGGSRVTYAEPVAAISDVHGNRWALQAVLEDIERRGVGRIVNLGDSLYGPLDPAGTARILLELEAPTVCGNEDRLIVESGPKPEDSPTLRYVRESLGPEHLRWLRTLERTAVAYENLCLCHGTPDRDDEYLLQEVCEFTVTLRAPADLAARLRSVSSPLVLCGHDHVPRMVRIPDGRLVVNPGSVGLPAYADDLPFPHVMENATPHARYCVISRGAEGWRIEHVAIPYDWEAAASVARANRRPDWARWLQSGRATLADLDEPLPRSAEIHGFDER